MTGFSRLVLFLLFFLPLAYFGASYYNGEDPLAKIQGWFGSDGTSEQDYNNHRPAGEAYDPNRTTSGQPATAASVNNMRSEITDLRRRLTVAESDLARCRATTAQ